jgi:hypothetical protein
MRKKNQVPVLCKDSADTVAARLKKGVGLDKAKSISDGFAKTFSVENQTDPYEGAKLGRFWTQVNNILKKEK